MSGNITHINFMSPGKWQVNMRAVVTVVGKDMVGIIAEVTKKLSDNNINIMDISQSILQDLFAMVMLIDISKTELKLAALSDELVKIGENLGVKIHVMHEDIFSSMHRI